MLRLAGGSSLPPADVYVRSFLYLLYTLIKLYCTKALSDPASSLAPDWILLLRRPRTLESAWFSNNLSTLSHTPSRQWSSKHCLSPGSGVLVNVTTSSVKQRQAWFLAVISMVQKLLMLCYQPKATGCRLEKRWARRSHARFTSQRPCASVPSTLQFMGSHHPLLSSHQHWIGNP